MRELSIIRIWFAASALILAALLVWSFAPILLPVAGIAAGIGGITVGIVSAARALERRLNSAQDKGRDEQ